MVHGVVIVGTGHGGSHAAVMLRQRGYQGPITMIGSDPELPYERPPLSKEYLAGERDFEKLLLRPPGFWRDRNVEVRSGRTIVSVDAEARTVLDDRGEVTCYDHLIWAAGGKVRRLVCEGHDLDGVHYLRDRADADRLRVEMREARQVVIIGGGYIGLEAAAALRKDGLEVVLLEAMERVLARVAGEPLSRFYEAEHRARGVDVRTSSEVACIEGAEGRVTGVRLSDGSKIAADIVVVGIGIVPEVAPLLAAGAQGANGVLVDSRCRTNLTGIFAIGDCALHRSAFAGQDDPIRIESVQNANEMAAVTAREITGDGEDYASVPWFWSNQYDLRLQTVGLSRGHDAWVIRGDPRKRSFSLVYFRGGVVVALDCVNAVRDYAQGKALVARRSMLEPALLADTGTALKDMAA